MNTKNEWWIVWAVIGIVASVFMIFLLPVSKAPDLEKSLWGKWEKVSGNGAEVIRFFPGGHVMAEQVKGDAVCGAYRVSSSGEKSAKRFLKLKSDDGRTAILEMEFSENYSVLTLRQLPDGNRNDFKKMESY